MKTKLVALVAFLFLLSCVSLSWGLTEQFWIEGEITTPVSEAIYDSDHFWTFNLTVANTNGSLYVSVSSEIPVVCWKALADVLEQGKFYNFSGAVNDVQVGEKPIGAFLVSNVNVQEDGFNSWSEAFWAVVETLSSVFKGLVITIVALLAFFLDVHVPELGVTLLLVGFLSFFIIKNIKALSLVFLIVLAFLIFSGSANIVRLIFLT